MRWFRRKRERPPIDESAAYARSYGDRGQEVKVVKLPPKRPRFPVLMSGEELRKRFEERLAKRDEEERDGSTTGQPSRLAAMHTLELNDDELRLLHDALHSYLNDFGHEQADILRRIKALLEKLHQAGAAH